ncbi:MAG: hypothetical protein QOK05_276 [Chloroflexota bacterium]|jgi:hypothetical protein|nr:hypothetical protein [Chloroflexota bacterium]
MRIDPNLSELTAVRLVSRLKAQYVRLVDLKRWAELEQLFVADFVFQGNESGRGAAAFIKLVSGQLTDANTVHALHMPEVDIRSPGTASAVWPFEDVIDQRRDGIGLLRRGYGHYHDDYLKVDGRWRIKAMRITRLRVECHAFRPDGDERRRVCFSNEELATWLAENRPA